LLGWCLPNLLVNQLKRFCTIRLLRFLLQLLIQ
jgi:hypothetical protein